MTMNPFDVPTSPTTEPESLLVGSFTQWRRLLDYDGASYTLEYRLIAADDESEKTISGTWDGSNNWWVFSVAAADMDLWTTGRHRWDLILTRLSDSETAVVSTGSLILHATAGDRRTHAEIMVAKIESLLEGRAASDIETYSIKSRSLTKMSVKELREWREYYVAEVERTGGSATKGNRPPSNTLRVRFT